MNVASLANSYSGLSALASSKPESAEVRQAGPDHDGDADDRNNAVSTPTVNSSGQTIGKYISVKA